MKLFLRPNDTLFFRDGRPFTRGEQTEGYSIFPPFPSTIMGALRSAWISKNGGLIKFRNGKMKSEIGTKDSLKGASIAIKGVFVGRDDGEIYYPIPRDLVAEKKSEDLKLYPLTIESSNFPSNSKLTRNLIYSGDKVVEGADGLVTKCQLRKALIGEIKCLKYVKSDFVLDEPKVGIARDPDTHASQDGMLYRLAMKRFADPDRKKCVADPGFGLIVDVEGIDLFAKKGLLRLGGEGKTCARSDFPHETDPLSDEELGEIETQISENKKFKIYFATPAIFGQGWLPKKISADDLKWKIMTGNGCIQIELITAAIGNYTMIGGWNVAKVKSKKAYRAVPAGSVYYFKLINGTNAKTVIDFFHNRNHSDFRSQEGFGLTYVGV